MITVIFNSKLNLWEFNRNVYGYVDWVRVKHMLELNFSLGNPLMFTHANQISNIFY